MALVRFVLRDPNAINETRIHLIYRLKTDRLVYPLPYSVKPTAWDSNQQRIKTNKKVHRNEINEKLSDYANKIATFVESEQLKGKQTTKEDLRRFIDSVINPTPKVSGFFGFAENMVKTYQTKINPSTKKPIAKGTIKSLQGTINLLKRYEKEQRYKITFESITLDFYYSFVEFMQNNLLYSINNTGKHIKNIKVFLNQAYDDGLHNNLQFKSRRFVVLKEDVDNIYLTVAELERLNNVVLPTGSVLERARDLFLIGSFTGLRVSDFNGLKPENILNKNGVQFLKVVTQKTGGTVIVPMHPIVKSILERYDNKPPKAMADQTINEKIKLVGQMAELTEKIYIKTSKGGFHITKEYKKHELIKTHTARRSFCTNAYLSGVDTLDIMAISSHKTETAFKKYIKVTEEQHAEKMAKHPFFMQIKRVG